ncbi:MAG TPA: FkbM family methyltransferase [Candidatus Saccharimonadales bacterium]|nr:FkbM family methyltransferase [Candidatus Saccharimonadales bacterium]
MAPRALTTTPFERIKHALIPGPLYIRYRVAKEMRRGEPELRLLPFLVDPARNAVDVGANKGVYTFVLARLARHVYAFEPNPKIFRILRATAPRRATISPLALSDRSGNAALRVPYGPSGHSNQGGSLSAVKVSGEHTEVPVERRRLDDLDLPDIGFIKIDVEGHESAVLDGARATIARDRPALLVEMEEKHTMQPIETALAAMLDRGYHGFFLDRAALRPLDAFDPEVHHRHPRTGYVFNFIFLPRGR